MVFELLGRTFGNYGDRHRYLNSNQNIQEWIQEGFSEEEAKKLQWFAGKQSRGKLYGMIENLNSRTCNWSGFALLL
jgi:hypothetical protein